MKKYCISIGEDNAEKSLNVQSALFAAGFEWSLKCGGSDVEPFYGDLLNIGVNVVGCGMMSLSAPHGKATKGFPVGTVWLPASYVLANASDLDGAKNPWEIAEEGRRFVTDEEKANHRPPQDVRCHFLTQSSTWGECAITSWDDGFEYTVPIGYTFPKPWEIPPEGYRLVTDEEIARFGRPRCAKYAAKCHRARWVTFSEEWNTCGGNHAVPISFTFAPPVARMTHAEICKELGKNIEIIKESE